MAGTRRRITSITKAARTGKRELLEAMRDKIAATLDEGVAPRDMASLTKRLLEIDEELEAVIVEEQGDVIGDATKLEDAPFTPAAGAHLRTA